MIRPRGKRLVVVPLADESLSQVIEVVQFDRFNTKASGVTAKSWTRGRVVSVSEDCDHENGAMVGDVVRFTKNGGLPVRDDDTDYLLLSEKDLIGIEEHGNCQ
jgi:co-chaperonin GroES (HSP10)